MNVFLSYNVFTAVTKDNTAQKQCVNTPSSVRTCAFRLCKKSTHPAVRARRYGILVVSRLRKVHGFGFCMAALKKK